MENFIYKKKLGITALSASLEDFSYKKHAHEEYALGVTLKGKQEYSLDGFTQASYASGVMLFNPEQVHDGRSGKWKDTVDYVMLYIKPKLFLEAVNKKDIVQFSSPIVYKQNMRQSILNLSYAILNEKDEALCSELLLNVTDNFTTNDFTLDYKKDSSLIKKAKEMIYYEIENVLDLDVISKELNMTKFQFIRLFKTHTKTTPYQFFLNSKLIHAKKYLEKTKDLYATVVEFGFSDLSHFNRHFKRFYGVTPYEYLLSIYKLQG